MRFSDTIRPLALATLAGIAILAGPYLPGAGRAFLFLMLYLVTFAYGTVLVLVVPILAVWPPLRRPGYFVAAIWGATSSVCAFVIVFWRLTDARQTALTSMPGAVSGLLYAWLVRRSPTKSRQN
jgi:hypothetical protein